MTGTSFSRRSRRGLAALVGLTLLTPTATPAQAGEASRNRQEPVIAYHEWRSAADLTRGELDGTTAAPDGGALVVGTPVGTVDRDGPGGTRTYEYATWTSPERRDDLAATELVPSWNAVTPAGTWLRVEVRAVTAQGGRTGWYSLGDWASGDSHILRTTVPGQSDSHARVNVDTLVAAGATRFDGYQLRVTLYREAGSDLTPELVMAGAMVSDVPTRSEVPTGPGAGAWGTELAVPRYSQNVHRGKYPEYGGGGEVWCSPTSTTMLLEYWGVGPTEEDLSWIEDGYVDPQVAHAARHTYDHDYAGAGNWPFNTAYAAHFGLRAHVTRLASITELEEHIMAGIPVITSVSFRADELDGAGYGTNGHLFVVVGFDDEGNVIVNDPASTDNEAVRRVYDRDQFNTVWLRTQREGGSGPGGIAYVIRDADTPLP
ncbi:C39 family peptidase [Actinoalloteichus caeruleus]|uniref:C39 family peptidase n=1 Tax=Actinoalloteichus cyanogriseus TaxID=2893586 RepID=UPI0004AA09B6|nr:C39 family peptidase [Actinoalloteichus caeruleus]